MDSAFFQVVCLAILSCQLAESYKPDENGLFQYLSRKLSNGRGWLLPEARDYYERNKPLINKAMQKTNQYDDSESNDDDDFSFDERDDDEDDNEDNDESDEEIDEYDRKDDYKRSNGMSPSVPNFWVESKRSHPKTITCHLCQIKLKEGKDGKDHTVCERLNATPDIECRLERLYHTNEFFMQYCVAEKKNMPFANPSDRCPRHA